MSQTIRCRHCNYDRPGTETACIHCYHVDHYPNVALATDPDEETALNTRYSDALKRFKANETMPVATRFEQKCTNLYAVSNRCKNFVENLALDDHNNYATYYQKTGAKIQFPKGDRWDKFRKHADLVFFDGFAEKIRFAALSIDGLGLTSYGNYSLVFREDMIAHRTTVFECNTTMFFINQMNLRVDDPPPGYRASWENRARLCVAKLADRLAPETPDDAFPEMLLKQGENSDCDEFVEVHILGHLTIRSVAKVLVKPENGNPNEDEITAMRETLKNKYDICLEVIG